MSAWMFPSLFALANFGLWGFFSKLSVNNIDPKSAFFYQIIGAAIFGLICLSFVGFKPAMDVRGATFGILTGAAASLGAFFFFIASSKGSSATVVTLTALYPVITIILSFLVLKEAISLRHCAGIVLALAAMYLFAR